MGGTPYTFQTAYDDNDDVLTQTYPTGEVVTTSYTSQGWLSGLSTQQGSTMTTLLSNVSYIGTAGAAQLMTGAQLGGGIYQYAATYDLALQLTDLKYTQVSNGATLFEEARTLDRAGNVTTLTTTLPQGTDQQQFCYDEQNRLTWAGAVGTPPCTGSAITPGTLTSAQYTQSFIYDTLDRLTSGPLGTYTYGDSAHVHAVTSIGSAYTASYDTAGNMICRAPSSSTTCSGTSTGAQLSYDVEGQLSHWQNAPSSPSAQDDFLYDGEGNRIEQKITQGSTTTTTIYIGAMEEVSTTGSSTTTTTYYDAGSGPIAEAVNGTFSYLVSDGLESVSATLDANGNLTSSQLYTPYGSVRYSSGTLPTSLGFTGQHADSTTGLDYYNARYYDPAAGRFTSADTLLAGGGYDFAGLDRYGYVGNNPETYTDPTGHCFLGLCNVVNTVINTVSTVVDQVLPIPAPLLPPIIGIGISLLTDPATWLIAGGALVIMAGVAVGLAIYTGIAIGIGIATATSLSPATIATSAPQATAGAAQVPSITISSPGAAEPAVSSGSGSTTTTTTGSLGSTLPGASTSGSGLGSGILQGVSTAGVAGLLQRLFAKGGDDDNDYYNPRNRDKGPNRLRGSQSHGLDQKLIRRVIKLFGLNDKQAGQLQRAIEDAKATEGRGNDDNLTFDDIVEIATDLFGPPPG